VNAANISNNDPDQTPLTGYRLSFGKEPEFEFVRDLDEWDLVSSKTEMCGTIGRLTYNHRFGLDHSVVRCDRFDCQKCAPLRCHIIELGIGGHWSPYAKLWLYRLDSNQPRESLGNQRDAMKARLATVTDAIRAKGGKYIAIGTFHDGVYQLHVFSSVDHSTTRPNRGNPPRRCEILNTSDALDYAGELLRHGIVWRSFSRGHDGWNLFDGERGRRANNDNNDNNGRAPVHLGSFGRRKAAAIEEEARRLHVERDGREWERWKKTPPLSADDAEQLYLDATANVVKANTWNVV
jgi:hypothetical protein